MYWFTIYIIYGKIIKLKKCLFYLFGGNMKSAVKTVSSMFFIILLSKVLGQVREMALAVCYGTSYEASAFVAASQIPLNLFDVVLGAAIVSAFVPVFNEELVNHGKKEAFLFANNFFNIVLLISIIISLLGVLFSSFLVSIITFGLSANTMALTSTLLKIMFPMVIFTAGAFAFAGILQSMGEFNIPAAMSVVSNLITIIYFVFFNKYFGILGLSIAMLLGWSVQLVFLIPSLKKYGFKYKFIINFKTESMKKVYKLMLPILLSSWVQPINVLINTALASNISENAISALNYANKLYLIIVGVFAMAITNLILPKISKHISEGKEEDVVLTIKSSLKSVFYFIMPLFVIFIIQI